jgi:hypothetical protein
LLFAFVLFYLVFVLFYFKFYPAFFGRGALALALNTSDSGDSWDSRGWELGNGKVTSLSGSGNFTFLFFSFLFFLGL